MTNEENLKRVRFFESERIFLTPLMREDTDIMYRWDNIPALGFSDGGHIWPCYPNEVDERMEKLLTNKTDRFFMIINKETGDRIGVIVLHHMSERHRNCQIGLVIDPSFHRQAYGTEATRLVLRYIFEDLGIHRLRSGCHAENTASRGFQESMGFVLEGIFRQDRYIRGHYVDNIQFGLLRDEYFRLDWVKKEKAAEG